MTVQIKSAGLSAGAEKTFDLIIAAAITGERCPQSHPHGPLQRMGLRELIDAGLVRSEVYAHNYRVVTVLSGEHAGKNTRPAPAGRRPYMIDGRRVKDDRA